MKYFILLEKPSARKAIGKALGGDHGTYKGIEYQLGNAVGHVLNYPKDPSKMVSDDKVDFYKTWSLKNLPWDPTDFNYKRVVAAGKMDVLKDIKRASDKCDVFVIATDVDPSGEGDLIGVEIIQAIGWKKPVKRMPIIDESVNGVKKAFDQIYDIPKLAGFGEFLKAETRSRYDYNTMQFARMATMVAREQGINVTLRNGRLKSVIIRSVFEQEELIRRYKKIPYFELRFKDDKGTIFKRKYEDGDDFRVLKEDMVDVASYKSSAVVETSRSLKKSAPPKLLTLDKLGSDLAAKGFKSKEIETNYQKLYEAGLVSYPRTEDKFINEDQFKEMLPLVDDIARLVGVDPSFVSVRTPRSTHIKNGGAHGANRPGLKVPSSLAVLSRYDVKPGLSQLIYETLARNYLAMMCPDYEYESVSAELVDYPDFKGIASIPKVKGFKEIYDDNDKSDDKQDDDEIATAIGVKADPFVYQGSNPKPAIPSLKWLRKRLEKFDVGTGATRLGTIAELTSDTLDRRMIEENKGRLSLTLIGKINGLLLKDTYIASPKITEQLEAAMKDVGLGKRKPMSVVNSVASISEHDIDIMVANGKSLQVYLKSLENTVGKVDAKLKKEIALLSKLKKKVSVKREVIFKGERIALKTTLLGARDATDDELAKLLSGNVEALVMPGKYGKYLNNFQITNDPKYGWIIRSLGSVKKPSDKIKGLYVPLNKEIEFKPVFMTYKLSDDEKETVLKGESISVSVKTKDGKDWSPKVYLEEDKKWGWQLKAVKSAPKKASDISDMKSEFSGYVFTDAEKQRLLAGDAVLVTMKSGKKAYVMYGPTEFKGRKYIGYYVDSWL